MNLNMRLDSPQIVFVCGAPSVGKSTIAKGLTQKIDNSCYIDKDTINDSFLATMKSNSTFLDKYLLEGPLINRTSDHYHEFVKCQTLRSMLELAKENLLLSKTSFLDAPLVKEMKQGYFEEIVPKSLEKLPFSYNPKIIFCYLDEKNHKQRMIERESSKDAVKLQSEESWRKFITQEIISSPITGKYSFLRVDTNLDLRQNLLEIEKYLNK